METRNSCGENLEKDSVLQEENNTEFIQITAESLAQTKHQTEQQSQTPATTQKENDSEVIEVETPVSAFDLQDELEHKHTNNKKKGKKKVWTFLLFLFINVVVIAITSMFEYHGEQVEDQVRLRQIALSISRNWHFLIIALLFALGFYVFQSLKIMRMIKVTTGKAKARTVITSVVLGKYYNNVTPFSFIGQPFQVWYLRRNKVTVGTATAAPVVQYFLTMCAYLTIALVAFIFFGDAINSTLIKITAYVGVSVTALTPTVIILFSIMPKTISKLVSFGIGLLHKMHIVKDPEDLTAKVLTIIKEFRLSIKFMWKSKSTMLIGYGLSLLEKLSELSITYFVMLACGLDHGNYLEVTAITLFIYAASSVVPTPGKAGASEGTFYILFESFWPMFIWRIFSYYFYLAVGFITILFNGFRNTLKQKEQTRKIGKKMKST